MALTRDKLLDHLAKAHRLDRDQIDDDTPLFSSRRLDSFAMVGLIVLIEKEAGIKVRPRNVSLANLDSIANILRFAEDSLAALAPAR